MEEMDVFKINDDDDIGGAKYQIPVKYRVSRVNTQMSPIRVIVDILM
jgi:hypothetical protein